MYQKAGSCPIVLVVDQCLQHPHPMAQVLLHLKEPALSAHSGLYLSLSIGLEELPLTLMGSLGCPAHGPRARVSHDLSLLFSESLLLFISSKQHGHEEMEVCSCLCILHVPSNIQGKWQALQALPPNLSHVPRVNPGTEHEGGCGWQWSAGCFFSSWFSC